MIENLRIHIAALGFLGDRIYAPAIEMKADVVYLLKFPEEKHEKAIKALKGIRTKLKKESIDLQEIDCQIFQTPDVVKTVQKIMLKNSKSNFFFNISSGNTLSSNALTVTAMLHKDLVESIKLYYKSYDYEKMVVKELDIIDLPIFKIKTPTKDQQTVLKLLEKNTEGLSKKQILIELDSNYSSKDRNERSKQLMKLNRNIIDKLCFDWKLINITGRSKNSIVNLTENGRQFVKFI